MTLFKDRQEGKCGGVALFVRDGIRTMAREDLGSENVESIWVEGKSNK